MEDLDVLARDFGLAARGKANPMRSAAAERRGAGDPLFSEVFGGQAKYTPTSNSYGNHKQSAGSDLDYASIFQSTSGTGVKKSNVNEKSSPVPVYDKPMYDGDIFDGLPGVKSKSGGSTVKFDDDVFASISSTGRSQNQSSNFDDLLGNFGRGEKTGEKNKSSSAKSNINSEGFDDLLAGFGNGSPNARNRFVPESRWRSVPDAASNLGNTLDDPFVVLESNSAPNTSSGRFTDPLEEIGKLNKLRSAQVEAPSGGGAFDDLDPLSTIGKSAYSNSRSKDNGGKDGHPMPATSKSAATKEPTGNSSFGHFKSNMKDEVPVDKFQEPPIFDVPNVSMDFQKSSGQPASSPQHYDTGPQADTSASGQGLEPDDAWLTVSEVPLFTQSSTAPPPSRPPPPIPRQASRPETRSYSSSFRKKGGEFSPPSSPQSLNLSQPEVNSPLVSQFDDLEGFSMGRSRNSFNGTSNLHSNMETTSFSEAAASAAAMKDAMDKAEAKFRHAKEAREREQAKAARNKEFGQVEKDEHEAHERKFRESQVRLERERKHKEEEEREQRRLEKERLREMESQKARQAVERAAREARERAAVEARERASAEVRLRAERAAVEKANAEARLRAERAALQRAQAEARERAAAEAKERAEKAAAEAKERAEKAAAAEAREKDAAASRIDAEAKRRAERAAVERAAAEARERAAAQARERAASAARKNQQTNDNDLESFFSMGRASSAPRSSSNTTDPFFNQQFNSKSGSDGVKQAPPSSGAPSTMKKASSTSSFVDDLSSIFGAAPSGEFQEIEGEPEERRKARLERHQRTQERAAKALAEKNQRDLQTQREQQERHRVADTLDIEIKRWAAGKEGNLRALLSTLQYVLWPECGWQPVSLTDLITAASVKKVYRKATLCVHPDKVQQKGANLQQKYIAEKVFDLLKEAWNKFNSEELF